PVHSRLRSLPTRRSSDLFRRERPAGRVAGGARRGNQRGKRVMRVSPRVVQGEAWIGNVGASANGAPSMREPGGQEGSLCWSDPTDRKSTRLNSSHLGISY